MYVSKYNGKNQYSFCDNALSGSDRVVRAPDTADNDSRSSYRTRGKIGDYIFNCLYESTDLNKTLPLVLQLMGTHFSLGRVAIAEIQKDTMVITRQWNASGVKQLEKTIDYTGELRALFESSRSIGHMSLRYNSFDDAPAEVKQKMIAAGIDDVKAFLHCPLLDGGIVRGYIAFFDCQATRTWSDEERETLSYVARLISLFVFKQQAHEDTLQAYNLASQVLDCSPITMYVINPNTYELLYVSPRAEKALPESRSRAVCHKAFFDFDTPCDFCPIPKWREQGEGGLRTYEFFSPSLNEWGLVSVNAILSPLGNKVCLCGRCFTTRFKEHENELEAENARLRKQVEALTQEISTAAANTQE